MTGFQFPWERFTTAAKSGHPARLVTYNAGVNQRFLYTTHQDYWPGNWSTSTPRGRPPPRQRSPVVWLDVLGGPRLGSHQARYTDPAAAVHRRTGAPVRPDVQPASGADDVQRRDLPGRDDGSPIGRAVASAEWGSPFLTAEHPVSTRTVVISTHRRSAATAVRVFIIQRLPPDPLAADLDGSGNPRFAFGHPSQGAAQTGEVVADDFVIQKVDAAPRRTSNASCLRSSSARLLAR